MEELKILVTGATGFIGSHMVKYLKDKGYAVIGCGRSQKRNENIRFVECDLTQQIPDLDINVIVHAAGRNPSGENTFNDYFENNIIATEHIVKYAQRRQVKKIIYIGTLASYGLVNQELTEKSPHNNPGEYGLTKYVAEQLVRNSGVPYHVLIPATVMGEGCGNNWIIRTAKALYHNQDVTYYNGKELFNNILQIEDMCAFAVKLLEQRGSESDVYLLGSNEMTTVEKIVVNLKEQLLSVSRIYHGLERKDPFYLNIDKALHAGFCPRTIGEILDEVCMEVKNNHDVGTKL